MALLSTVLRTVLAAAAVILALASPAYAVSHEYGLKAAFIYRIAHFVTWPDPGPELRLCIYGGDPFGNDLGAIDGREVGGRELTAVVLDGGDDVRGCEILFIVAEAEPHVDRIVALARGAGMLTIGDTEGFARRGVMVNFFLEDDKIRFEINLEAARHGGLTISSRLLALARIVGARAEGGR